MKNNKKDIPMWARTGHKKPMTRRELLASGLLTFSGTMALPGILSLLVPREAMAAGTCASPVGGFAPFITVNLEGGAGLLGNYVVQDAGGQNLPSYSILGLGSGATLPTSELEFGGVPFAGKVGGRLTSQFLQGMRDAGGTALVKTAFVAVCGGSRDDFSQNELSVDGMLAKAGIAGSLLPSLGTARTPTGIRQNDALLTPPSPLVVQNTAAITGAIGYSSAVQQSFNMNQRVSLAKAVSRLSEVQTRKLASIASSADLKPLVDCVNSKNMDLQSAGSSLVDPLADTMHGSAISTIWRGITTSTSSSNQDRVFSMMVYNAIKGQAGSVGLSMGGYDYHDKTRTTGDAADYKAGQVIGSALATAEAMNSPLFIYVCTDGSVVSENSDTIGSPWTSDGGNIRGVAFMLYYHPAGRVQTSGHQIGSYTSGQVPLATTAVGSAPKAMAAAVFANYLAVHNKLSLFNGITGSFFSSSDLTSVVKMSSST